MARQGRIGPREEDRVKKEERRRKGRAGRRNILLGGLATLVVLVVVSSYVFLYIVGTVDTNGPELEMVDIVGTKPSEATDTIVQVKITVRNIGGGSMDLQDAVLTWTGPGVDTTLHFNADDPAGTDKDSFGVGGAGTIKDGWDPDRGIFKLKPGTVAWFLVNLTDNEGIGDVLGPDHGITVKVKVEGSKVYTEATYKVPGDLGNGRFVALTKVGN